MSKIIMSLIICLFLTIMFNNTIAQLYKYEVNYFFNRPNNAKNYVYYFDYYLTNDSLFISKTYENRNIINKEKLFNYIGLFKHTDVISYLIINNDSIVIFNKLQSTIVDLPNNMSNFIYGGLTEYKGVDTIIGGSKYYLFETFSHKIIGDGHNAIHTKQIISSVFWLPYSLNVRTRKGMEGLNIKLIDIENM